MNTESYISSTRLQRNFNRAAARYDDYAAFQQAQMLRVLELARATIPAHARVLDVGCGTGRFAESAQGQSWRLTGLDIAQAMCRIARKRCHDTVRATATALPFADGSFNGVVSSLCLQWVMNKPQAMNEMFRVLKPGGTAIIATLGDETLVELRTQSSAYGIDLHLLAMASSDAYQRMTKQSGFEMIRAEDKTEIQHYPSATALLHSMQRIGAGNTTEHRFIPPKKFQMFLRNYDNCYASGNGVLATWQPVILQARKPA